MSTNAPTVAELREHLGARGGNARCPAHEDKHASLSISAGAGGKVLLKCHAGCTQSAVIEALRARGIWPQPNGLTVAELAAAKGLPESLLRESGFADDEVSGRPVIRMDYRGTDGEVLCIRYRGALAANGSDRRFWFRKGDRQQLFGLWRLKPEPVIVVEGETDSIALWAAGLNAVGVPGAEAWRDSRFAPALAQCQTIYVHVEPDAGGEKLKAAFERSSLRGRVRFFTVAPTAKDPCELRARDPDGFLAAIQGLLEQAQPARHSEVPAPNGNGEEMPDPPPWMDESPPNEEPHETVRGSRHSLRSDGSSGSEPPPAPRRPPISWDSLEGLDPPPREWVIPRWIPAGHTTLLAGRGGIGKTLIAQHIATALALGHEYIEPLTPRRVLMWAGEDDEAELWRRQLQISSWMGQPLSALTERFYLHSYAGADITLMAPVFGALTPTPMLTELREQVADYRAEVVILDNIARLFGGSENDRHAVTTFVALVQGACAPAGVLLLGHPAKAVGSEYSGSTAWEGAVRARLYLSDRAPDQDPADDDAPVDESVRYLARRKANYSPRDIRRLTMADGVLIPAAADPAKLTRPSGEFVKDIVRRAARRLAERDIYGSAASRAGNFLPKLAKQYRLLETASEKAFAAGMREMILAGELVEQEIGKYGNRSPKRGLALAV
jgi:AAA domain